ncbi:putative tail sheath protein [Aeromonas phage 14AhydR10PP]|nr:putative tail sheath protein [Aeromonas phage 14AhydR10PP]
MAGSLRSSDFLHGVEHFWLEDAERPIEVMAASVVGIVGISEDADPITFPLNKPVLVNSDKFIAKAGKGPMYEALQDIYRQGGALCVVIRVSETDNPNVEVDPVVGTVAADGSYSGMQALLAAETVTGVRPTLLMLAVGKQDLVTHVPALSVIGDKLHAIPVVSMLEGGPSAAMAAAEMLDGVYFVYGTCWFGKDGQGKDIYRDPTATVMGHILRVDATEGYWHSPSSRKILGLSGMKNPVDHQIGSTTSTANILNSKNVTCIVQQKGGFYLYGNRLTGPKSMVLPHQRIRYIVGLSIQEAHQDLVDRNVTANYVESVKTRVNALLRRLELREVISGGECWVDGEVNKSLIGTNQVIWDYDLGYYDVAERCTFRQHVNRSYNEKVYA